MLAGDCLRRSRVSIVVCVALALLMRHGHAQSAFYSHEPTGFVTWASSTLDSFTGSGWNIVNPSGYATVAVDSGGSVTPPMVGQWKYPSGYPGGSAPATMYRALPSSFNEGFVGVMWKASNPWQGHSSFVNKIFFLLGGSCGNLIPIMYGPNGGPYHLRVAPEWGNWSWLTGNVNDPAITLGSWHKIELYFKYSSGGANGIIRWWMDGVAIGDYSNVTFPGSTCFDEFQFSPTWGGVGDVKSETDFFWFDDAYISQRGTGPTCTFTLSPSGAAPTSAAGSGTVNVTASGGTCPWTAVSNAAWISVTGGAVGTGNGTVSYSITANTAATPRTGTLTVAGQTFTVTQAGTSTQPPPATLLFQETFDDGNVAARGWYDNTSVLLSTTEHAPGSVNSLQYTFNQGATAPTAGSALRHKFTPGNSVYLGYWVKYSTNWVGSQKPYHPHEFHFLTTLEGDWAGLSFDHLTAYVEENGGTPLFALQDGSNVDQSRIGVDLTNITENRGVAGCNGSSDGYPDNCYSNGSQMVNEKKWRAAQQYFTDSPGAYYKSDWHYIEAFLQLNSIVAGKGVNDGVLQYWFDGQLLIDKHNVLLRTGANASMQFNQLVIAPWIGDGSPVTQTMWIDKMAVWTARPGTAPIAPTNLRIR